MSGKKDKNLYEDEEEYGEEEEDKKCPPNRHVSRSNPNEDHKRGDASLVHKEDREDTKYPPQQAPWSKKNEQIADHNPGKHYRHEHWQQPSVESSNHQKAHRQFEQKDEETIEMEEGVFGAEWEKFNEATDGHIPVSDPNEREVSIEARNAEHGSSGGERAVASLRGTDGSPGAEAVDGRAHPPNNAQRRTHAFPPTSPGAPRVPGRDNKGLDEDEDQMTFVSHEELIIPILGEAERVNTEDEGKRRHAPNVGSPLGIYRTNKPYWPDDVAYGPVADVVPGNNGRRRKLVGAFLLMITIATVIRAVLGIELREDETLSPSGYEETQPPAGYEETLAPSVYEALNLLLANVSFDVGEALRNSSTPQYEAFHWTVTNNTHLSAYSDEEFIQRYALATIFFSTNGTSWDYNTGWLSETDECTWYGVECTSSGAVSELSFEFGNNLTGTLPREIGLLSKLAYLNLGGNKLSGTVPSVIGKLSNSLEYLILGSNALEGMIPSEVGQLSKLTTLYLLENKLTGTIPSEMGMLSDSLEYLSLSWNSLQDAIPSEVGQLSKLTSLSLWYNKLTGTIPYEIGMLSDLEVLLFWNNTLGGTIPSEIGQLAKLTALSLFNNTLTGTIPSEIDSLDNLYVLYLFGNNFTGNYTCPKSIEECMISCDDNANDTCRSL